MNKIKEMFQKRDSKKGTYSIGLIAIVIGILIVVNLIIGQIPTKYTQLDISDNNLYKISKTSKKVLNKLDKDITIYVVAEKGSVDDRISKYIDKYASLSKHITVKELDPVAHPSVLTKYNTETDTLVVSCEDTDKSTTIAFSSIIVSDDYSYYTTGTATETEFDAEGQLTSAVNYVTSDEVKKAYRTTGHGESTFSTSVSEMIAKSNINVEELNTVMNAEIPSDCELLMMYAPTTDLTEDELSMYQSYMEAGGKMMILLGDGSTNTPNLESLMETYGMQQVNGYIADTQRYYQGGQSYFNIFPVLSLDDTLSKGITSEMVLVSNSLGMNVIDPVRDTITTTSVMTTSEQGYAVTEEEEQTQGTYTLAGVATEEVDDQTARMTVISASTLIDANITDQFTTLENLTVFMNMVTANFDGIENVSIAPKSLEVTYNTVQYGGAFSILVIFGIPLIILIAGIVVWAKRRKA